MKVFAALAILISLALPSTAMAQLEVEYPFAYPTSEKQKNGAAYFTLRNMTRQADKLLSVSSPIATMVQLHTTTTKPNEEFDMDVASMKMVEAFDVPEMSSLYFDPFGRHIMLMGLTKPLKAGDMFPLTLTFEKIGKVETQVLVVDNSYEIDVEGGEHWMPHEDEHEHEHEDEHEDEHKDEHEHGEHQH